MKRQLLLLISLLMLTTSSLLAQTAATEIDQLTVDIWPDYDRPSALVLMTGALAADTTLPAAVTVPLPSGAELNAVARITADNVMTDDIDFTTAADSVTLITPDLRFRVEYYLPYEVAGSQHIVDFTWLSETLSVNEIDVAVQQPAAATNLHTEPIATSISQNNQDGFTYHVLPFQAVPAGEAYLVEIDYTMSEPTLSVNQPPAVTDSEATNTGTATAIGSTLDWPLLIAGLGAALILIAVVWQVISSRRRPPRPRKTAPRRQAAAPKAARFCHECGTALQAHDKFCRNCGTAVKKQ